MRIRPLLLLPLFLAIAAPALADEPPATATPPTKDAPASDAAATKGIVPKAVALPGTAVAIAPDRAAGTFLVATQEAKLHRVSATKGVTWSASLGEHAADKLAASPRGDVVVAASALELLGVATEDGRVLWRAKRPVAFAFSADGKALTTVTKKGHIDIYDPATGDLRSTRTSEAKREVALASVHPASGLAVLGVADG